ncbi:MAG: hypothetical protein ABIH23_20155 [bacterium]
MATRKLSGMSMKELQDEAYSNIVSINRVKSGDHIIPRYTSETKAHYPKFIANLNHTIYLVLKVNPQSLRVRAIVGKKEELRLEKKSWTSDKLIEVYKVKKFVVNELVRRMQKRLKEETANWS